MIWVELFVFLEFSWFIGNRYKIKPKNLQISRVKYPLWTFMLFFFSVNQIISINPVKTFTLNKMTYLDQKLSIHINKYINLTLFQLNMFSSLYFANNIFRLNVCRNIHFNNNLIWWMKIDWKCYQNKQMKFNFFSELRQEKIMFLIELTGLTKPTSRKNTKNVLPRTVSQYTSP